MAKQSTITTSNLIGIPIAVLISSVIAIGWWAFQRGGEYTQMKSDINEVSRRMDALGEAEKRGRLWERLSEHGKDISSMHVDIARLEERSRMCEHEQKKLK